MSNVITMAIERSGGRIAQAGRIGWTLAIAVIAVVAGISTLNMVVANFGVATLHEVASPFMQQLARIGRQA
jgi:hypothetical protein